MLYWAMVWLLTLTFAAKSQIKGLNLENIFFSKSQLSRSVKLKSTSEFDFCNYDYVFFLCVWRFESQNIEK